MFAQTYKTVSVLIIKIIYLNSFVIKLRYWKIFVNPQSKLYYYRKVFIYIVVVKKCTSK